MQVESGSSFLVVVTLRRARPGSALHDAHVGVGIAQNQAAGFGEHQGVGVAESRRLEVQALGAERQMAVLGEIFRVDDQSTGCHSHLVENLAEHQVERAELAVNLGEVDSPAAHALTRGDHTRVVEFAEHADELATTNKHLALAALVASERLAHEVDHLVVVEVLIVSERFAGLVPDATGEEDVLLLVGIPQAALHTEEERLLHAEPHVVDGRFLLVGHRPSHLFVGEALQGALLDLHLNELSTNITLQ